MQGPRSADTDHSGSVSGPVLGPAPGTVSVQLLGPFAVVVGGHPVDVPTGRASKLLALLAVHSGELVSADVIIDALWAEPHPSAYQGVASLVSRLRRALGRHAIEGDRHGYRLAVEVETDLGEIEDLVTLAADHLRAGHAARAATPVQRALALVQRGQLVEAYPDSPWADDARRVLERQLRQARQIGWQAASQLGDHALAAELAEAATAADELDEAATAAAMTAWSALGQVGRAEAVYQQLVEALRRHLGMEPGDEIRRRREHMTAGAASGGPPSPEPEVTADRAPAAGHLAGGPPPAGRAEQTAALLDAWTEARRGCRLAVVSGVTGSGKSYLVDAVARRVAGAGGVVLHASSRGAERSIFLHPLAEMIADHLDELEPAARRDLVAGWEGPLHQLLPDAVAAPPAPSRPSAELEHRQALLAVAAILGRVAERHPTLLIVENLHHTAASALEAIDLARSTLHRVPLLIVGTVRVEPGVDPTDLLTRIDTAVEVGPFDLGATTALAEASGVGRLAGAIQDATGGDPLFVVEAIRLAVDAGTEAALDALAGTVRDVVMRRTRLCGPDVDELLHLAATFGAVFDLDDVAALGSLSPEDAAGRADRALAAGLVTVRQDRFAFASSVLRDVLYASTPPPIRVSRHRRAALGAPTPEARARHLDAAGQHAGAAEAWTEGADEARRRFANRDAERLLGAAVASAGRAGDDRRVVELLIARAGIRVDLVRFDEARADLEVALARSRELGAEDLETRALSALGWAAYYARDAEMASDYAVKVTLLAEAAASAPRALPGALALLGRVRHWAGDIDGAADAYRQALDGEPDTLTEASALSCLGALLEHGDRYGEAIEVLGRAITASEATSATRSLLRALFFAGLARANAGDLAGARRVLERKRAILERYDLHFYRARTATTLSWVWRELGDLGRAAELAAQALEESLAVDAGVVQTEQEVHAHQALAECALMGNDPVAAERSLVRASAALQGWLPFRWRAELRQIELETRLDASRAEELLGLARGRGSAKYEALALAHLGRPDLATPVAARTGSELLVSQVAVPARAAQAAATLAERLPAELRDRFVRRSPTGLLLR